MNKRRWISVCVWLCCLLLAAGSVLSVSAAMPQGYTKNRQAVVPQTGNPSKYVDYIKNGAEAAHGELPWVTDAARGRVLSLSGNGEYLRVTSEPLPLIKSSFTAWVNREDNGTEPILFSMTSNITKDSLTVSLHHNSSGQVDGVYLRFWHVDGNLNVELFNPIDEGLAYPIPAGEWHHIAFVSDGQYFRLYIDGALWFEQMVILSLVEMRANRLFVGAAGDTAGATLKGKLAQVYLFDKALSAEQVKTVMAGGNPFDGKSTTTTATDTPYFPTAPQTTAAPEPSAPADDDQPAEWGGIPIWTWLLCGGIIVASGVVSSLLNRRKKGGDAA